MVQAGASSQTTGLSIRLTEPCVFLRGGDSAQQRQQRRRARRAARQASRAAAANNGPSTSRDPTPGPSGSSQNNVPAANLRGGGMRSTRSPPRVASPHRGRNDSTSRQRSSSLSSPTTGRLVVDDLIDNLRGRTPQRSTQLDSVRGRDGSGSGSGSRGRRDMVMPTGRGGAGSGVGRSRERSRGRTPTRSPATAGLARDGSFPPHTNEDDLTGAGTDGVDPAGAGAEEPAGEGEDEEDDYAPAPAILRGLLNLHLAKPCRIRKISLKLKGMVRTDWPEGIGARRLEVLEEHELMNLSVVFFDAADQSTAAVALQSAVEGRMRRAASLGPNRIMNVHPPPLNGHAQSDVGPSLLLPSGSAEEGVTEDARGRGRNGGGASHRAFSVQPSRRLPGSEQWGPNGLPLAQPAASTSTSDAAAASSISSEPPSYFDANRDDARPTATVTVTASPVPSPAPNRTFVGLGSPLVASRMRLPSVPRIREDTADEVDDGSHEEASTEEGASTPVVPNGGSGSGVASSNSSLHHLGDGHASAPVPGTARSSLERGPSGEGPTFQSAISIPPPHPPPAALANGKRRDASPAVGAVLEEHSRLRSLSKTRFHLGGLAEALKGGSKRDESPARNATGRSKSRGRHAGLKAIKDALIGHADEAGDSDEEDGVRPSGASSSAGWREFKAGTYTYPISVPIPTALPPTLHCNFGDVSYKLKATVVRAGALTSNLHAETEVALVVAPGEDDTEETESIVVQREWGTQLSYVVALSGKSFPIGGHIPITIKLVPMAKMKVYRISAFLEEKIDYYAHNRRVTRHEGTRSFPLLRLDYPDPDTSLLPLLSDDPDAVAQSPLADFWINPTSSDDTTPACLDPLGPWDLEGFLQLPDCSTKIHFSCEHEKANISIKHWVKIIMRVERGDDDFMDSKGKRKRWDIIIETPVHILSCRCASNVLPAYSYYAPGPRSGTGSRDSCLCEHRAAAAGQRAPDGSHGHGREHASAVGIALHRPVASTSGHQSGAAQGDALPDAQALEGDIVLDVALDGNVDPNATGEDLVARAVAGAEMQAGGPPPAYSPSAERGRARSDSSSSRRGRSTTRGDAFTMRMLSRGDRSASGSASGSMEARRG